MGYNSHVPLLGRLFANKNLLETMVLFPFLVFFSGPVSVNMCGGGRRLFGGTQHIPKDKCSLKYKQLLPLWWALGEMRIISNTITFLCLQDIFRERILCGSVSSFFLSGYWTRDICVHGSPGFHVTAGTTPKYPGLGPWHFRWVK